MSFDKTLPSCFSETALEFAGHPSDEERASEWLASLRERKIGLAAAFDQVREYLELRGASEDHITRQQEKVAAHVKPWLLD